MKAESLALLAAKGQSWAMPVDGSPGERVTASDIAAACGHIRPAICAAVLRAKYCDDVRAAKQVLARLKGGCISEGHTAAQRLSEAVLKAFLIPPLCDTCHGRAQVQAEDLLITCPDCHGEGYRVVEKLPDRGLIMLSLLYRWQTDGLRQVIQIMGQMKKDEKGLALDRKTG